LGSRLLLVAAGAADRGVELVAGDGVQEDGSLEPVAGGTCPALLDDEAVVDALLNGRHHETGAEFGDAPVAELENLREVVTGVDMHHRERDLRRPEGLFGESEEDDRVLAARKRGGRASQTRRQLRA